MLFQYFAKSSSKSFIIDVIKSLVKILICNAQVERIAERDCSR
eukprot:Gb_02185 [translate_table: standard]